jgi:endonuclease/exonuclease/phosphatase family metal-dependent hydrolase
VARLSRRAPTFPSPLPVLEIDHVFVGGGVTVGAIRTPLDPLTRAASDHLPLVADLTLPV